MHGKGCPGILLVELFSHAGDKDHRKFQTLALVDTHNLHCIFIFGKNVRLPEIHLVFLQILYIPDKVKETPIAGTLIIPGLLKKHQQVGLLLFPGSSCLYIVKESCPVIDLPQQFMHGCVGNFLPDTLIQLQETACLLPGLPVLGIIRFTQTFRRQK